jgi:hypothetical protein
MPDTAITAGAEPVTVTTADSFVVVSLWRSWGGKSESYDYEPHATLNGALDAYREMENGEYPRARAIGIFAAKNGLPIGGRMEPATILRLMRETRAA